VSWSPNDLVTDLDLLAYEPTILTQFGVTDWQQLLGKAREDWLRPILQGRGFDLDRLRTRFEADLVQAYTGAVYTDKSSDAKDADVDDLNLAGIFATVGTDALYVGSTSTFRGLSVRMHAGVSAVTSDLTVSYWNDAWTPLVVTDSTRGTAGKSFSKGGSVLWRMPADWVTRTINGSDQRYLVKLTMSATPTAATAGQIGVVRRSALCAPLTFRTLLLIMRSAPTGGPGPWAEKAAWYESEADAALQRALQIIGGEFETDDPATDLISPDEADQTVDEVSRGPWKMERA
jgi:hypothetical protein